MFTLSVQISSNNYPVSLKWEPPQSLQRLNARGRVNQLKDTCSQPWGWNWYSRDLFPPTILDTLHSWLALQLGCLPGNDSNIYLQKVCALSFLATGWDWLLHFPRHHYQQVWKQQETPLMNALASGLASRCPHYGEAPLASHSEKSQLHCLGQWFFPPPPDLLSWETASNAHLRATTESFEHTSTTWSSEMTLSFCYTYFAEETWDRNASKGIIGVEKNACSDRDSLLTSQRSDKDSVSLCVCATHSSFRIYIHLQRSSHLSGSEQPKKLF